MPGKEATDKGKSAASRKSGASLRQNKEPFTLILENHACWLTLPAEENSFKIFFFKKSMYLCTPVKPRWRNW